MKKFINKVPINLNVNGLNHEVFVRPADTLLDILRQQLGLCGAKPGCLNGDCGACTVILDNYPVKSCLVLAVECDGSNIITVEGLKDTPIQQAFVDCAAFQCGYCTSRLFNGMLCTIFE